MTRAEVIAEKLMEDLPGITTQEQVSAAMNLHFNDYSRNLFLWACMPREIQEEMFTCAHDLPRGWKVYSQAMFGPSLWALRAERERERERERECKCGGCWVRDGSTLEQRFVKTGVLKKTRVEKWLLEGKAIEFDQVLAKFNPKVKEIMDARGLWGNAFACRLATWIKDPDIFVVAIKYPSLEYPMMFYFDEEPLM